MDDISILKSRVSNRSDSAFIECTRLLIIQQIHLADDLVNLGFLLFFRVLFK